MTTYPLNQSQLGIYLTCLNCNEEGNYNLDMLFHLEDDVDLERLRLALEAVVAAHPYVKSRLQESESGEPVFVDCTEEPFKAEIIDAGSIEELRPSLGTDYDLLHDRLFRLEIYRTAEDGNWLYVDFHHIIFDGVSWSVFNDDLARAYDGEALDAEKIDGFKIALDEVALREGPAYSEARDWYVSEFGPASELESMPLADLNGEEEHFAKYLEPLAIDSQALDNFCKMSGRKKSEVCTAAFGYTLSRFTAEEEVLFTTVFHGRNDRATRRSFTMMVRTLPVYQNFSGNPKVAEVLDSLAAQTARTRSLAAYSFADAHSDFGINSDVSFAYQGELHNLNITLCGKTYTGESLITHTPGLKFLGMLIIEGGVPHIWCEYQTNKYSANFIKGFWNSYACVVNGMCSCEKLSEISLCTTEQIKLLDSFNSHYVAILVMR